MCRTRSVLLYLLLASLLFTHTYAVEIPNDEYQELITIMEQLQILTEKQDSKLKEQEAQIEILQQQNNELQTDSQNKQKQLDEQQTLIANLQKTIAQSQTSYKEERKSSRTTNLLIDLIMFLIGGLMGGIFI